MSSSSGIRDASCPLIATSTDIDHCRDPNCSWTSSGLLSHIPTSIGQSENHDALADVVPTHNLILHSSCQTEACARPRDYFEDFFVYRLQRPQQTTISTGAVPDPTALIQALQPLTISRGAVPGYNLMFFDEGVSMVLGFEQFLYSQDEQRFLCINQPDHGELYVSIPDMPNRDAQHSDDTDFDQVAIQCWSDDFRLYLNALSSIGPQDGYASAELTSLQSEASSPHPAIQNDSSDDLSDPYHASLLTVGDSDFCDLPLVTPQSSVPTGDGPDPNVYDPSQLQCTISRGAVPVSNIDWFRMLRLVQTTGERVVEPARRDDDEDSWKTYSQSDLEDLDTLFRFDFRTMGSASTTLLYQNSDIPTKVEQSADDPLPFLRPSTVSVGHCNLPACPCNPAYTSLVPVNILQDTVILSVKNQLQLHQEFLQDTTSRGAVPDNNRLQLIFDLGQHRSSRSCPSQVAFVDYPTTPVDSDVTEGLSYCHGYRTASLWPGDLYHAQPQESQWSLTVSSHTNNSIRTQQLLQEPSVLDRAVLVTNHVTHTPFRTSFQLDVDGGPDRQLQRHTTISSGTVPSYILGPHCCSSADLMEVYGQGHLPVDIENFMFPTLLCDRGNFNLLGTPQRGGYDRLCVPRHQNNDVVHTKPQQSASSDSFRSMALARNNSQSSSFRGWGGAIYRGGHPAWGRCEIIHMEPNPSFAERCAAATQDNGWLASDEALWFLRLLRDWRSDIAIGPIIQWSPSRDLQHLMAAEDQLQCNNGQLNILLFLVEAHWCAVEIDRRTEPAHVILIQWPTEHHTMVILEVSRILQIPSHRMLVTLDDSNEVVTMCGWTILFRWYTNFAMQTCLQPLIHANEQDQIRIDSVIHRAQRQWDRTNASTRLRRFAAECRRAFMSAYARDQPDTRLPNSVSTVMFVGPQEDYVQEVSQVPRPPRLVRYHDRPHIEKGRSTGYVICLSSQLG